MFRDSNKNKVRKREKQADNFVNHYDQLWSHKVSSVTDEEKVFKCQTGQVLDQKYKY